MAIQDEKLNKDIKEKNDLIKKLDKDPNNDELKRLLRNCKERIRVRTQKFLEDNKPQEELFVEQKKSKGRKIKNFSNVKKDKKPSMKIVVTDALKSGMSVDEIVEKYKYKKASVQWYKSKEKL